MNSEVESGRLDYRNRDRDAAKAHLEAALAEASRLHFSLGDVITRVEFKPERRQNPEWYHMLGRRETTIAGEPAVIVDYTVKVPERPHTFSAREAYFVHNSHLFICTFIGLQDRWRCSTRSSRVSSSRDDRETNDVAGAHRPTCVIQMLLDPWFMSRTILSAPTLML